MPKRRRLSDVEAQIRCIAARMERMQSLLRVVQEAAQHRLLDSATSEGGTAPRSLHEFAADVAVLSALAQRTTANEEDIRILRRRIGELTSGMCASVPQPRPDPLYRQLFLAVVDSALTETDNNASYLQPAT